MKLKYFLILNLILITINFFCQGNSNYKIYHNEKAKFSFKYNSNKFIVFENYNNIKDNEIYNIVIQVDEINKLDNDAPYGLDKGTAISEKESLEKGKKGSGIDVASDIELIEIDKKYGEIITVLSRDSIEDITFERQLLFFNNNCRVIVTLYGNNKKIIDSMPNFFDYDKESKSYSWLDKSGGDSVTDFINSIKKVKNKNLAVDWFNSIYDIIKEIKFNNIINSSIIYKPKVDNLRFREIPDLKGKFIRSLIKGEKLELIETGKSDTIDGVKGNWVKVKTEKGEIGWSFDAYLEEVKDDNVKKIE